MGGQEGNRGYLLQAIIAVLNSLNSLDWVVVSIEPEDDQEKVDIVWTDSGHLKTVCQVEIPEGLTMQFRRMQSTNLCNLILKVISFSQ